MNTLYLYRMLEDKSIHETIIEGDNLETAQNTGYVPRIFGVDGQYYEVYYCDVIEYK